MARFCKNFDFGCQMAGKLFCANELSAFCLPPQVSGYLIAEPTTARIVPSVFVRT